jgi:hypothetical protein
MATEQEVRDLFAPLGVRQVRELVGYNSQQGGDPAWEVTVTSGTRQVGRFAYEQGLLDRIGGSGSYRDEATFYFDNRNRNGQMPKSWLPKAAQTQDDYAADIVALKKALIDAGYGCSYLRMGVEEGVKITDDAVPYNLSFVWSPSNPNLQARFLTGGKTFHNDYRFVKVTVEQAVELVRRSAALLTGL